MHLKLKDGLKKCYVTFTYPLLIHFPKLFFIFEKKRILFIILIFFFDQLIRFNLFFHVYMPFVFSEFSSSFCPNYCFSKLFYRDSGILCIFWVWVLSVLPIQIFSPSWLLISIPWMLVIIFIADKLYCQVTETLKTHWYS